MFHKKTLLSLVVLGLVLTAGIAQSYAFGGNSWASKGNLTIAQLEQRQAHQAQIQSFMESGDYQAWQEFIAEMQAVCSGKGLGVKNISELIKTQEDFNKFIELHKARQAGDYTTAQSIAKDLGFVGKMGQGMGRKMSQHRFIDSNGDGVCDLNNMSAAR